MFILLETLCEAQTDIYALHEIQFLFIYHFPCMQLHLFSFFLFQGDAFDDCLSHFMCCCCALVQEWREVEIRGNIFDNFQSTDINCYADHNLVENLFTYSSTKNQD